MNTPKTPSAELIQALAVTAEVTATDMSKSALRAIAEDLTAYSFHDVINALRRCRRELTGKLTLAAIIQRIDDGRPGPEEAWAMIPHNEAATLVWTREMQDAYAIARTLIVDGDTIPARMAFLEHYRKALSLARNNREPVQWQVSPGTDPHARETAIREAALLGRITPEYAQRMLPHIRIDQPPAPANILPTDNSGAEFLPLNNLLSCVPRTPRT